MKRQSTRDWKSWITENGSYKLVALFVTLILWVTILGRRDFQLTREMNVEFVLPQNMVIADQGQDPRVLVKVSGPRMALKRFQQNPGAITIDLARSQPGVVRAVITPRRVEVPFGVKVISVTPDVISVRLIPSAPSEGAAKDGQGAGAASETQPADP